MKKLILVLIFAALNFAAYSQIGLHKNRLLREIDGTPYTETLNGDTTIISFNSIYGSVFFIKFERSPQVWYFVDNLSVKVIISQSRIGHLMDKMTVKKKWKNVDDYYVKGNRAVAFYDRKYEMWRYGK